MSRHDESHLEHAKDTRITPDMAPAEIELRVRRRIEKRREEITGFVGNLVSYLAVNAVLWTVFVFAAKDVHSLPWPLFATLTLGWGIGLIIHGYLLYQNLPRVVARREQSLQREVARVKAEMGISDSYGSYVSSDYSEKPKNTEKPKNDQPPMRLTDDGEIVPDVTDFDQTANEARRRNQLTHRMN